jgi:hypothetical protein
MVQYLVPLELPRAVHCERVFCFNMIICFFLFMVDFTYDGAPAPSTDILEPNSANIAGGRSFSTVA